MVQQRLLEEARLLDNHELAPTLWSMTLEAPRIAEAVVPGQFVQVKVGGDEFTLRRPISVYQADVRQGTLALLYQVVGRGTESLSRRQPEQGQCVSLIGPLGNGWPVPKEPARALLIGGGVGVAPLALLAQRLKEAGHTVTCIQAAQTAERLVARAVFEKLCDTWRCATDDGTAGVKGLVTLLLAEVLETETFDVAYVCGPEVMTAAVADLAARYNLKLYVSLERLMACGIGACLGCVIPTRSGQQKVCYAGPVFAAQEVIWDELKASRIH